jgi:UDP-N-acetylmuramoyl-tripeptide--D-alanyl-D-alanine ligase
MYATYHVIAEALTGILLLILLRHAMLRGRFFLHRLQQNGYKRNEYAAWMRSRWAADVMPGVYAWINILFVALLFWGRDALTPTSVHVILFVFGLVWFLPGGTYTAVQKKPIAYTPRMKRLAATLAALSLILPAAMLGRMAMAGRLLDEPVLPVFTLVTTALIQPFLVWLAAVLTSPVETRIQNGFIAAAKRKLAALPDLKIIAITGSYGKTSTKFVMKTLLSERYNVCFTPGSFNTPMGITKVINDDLDATHQILILEMGARYAGNIDELCRIARPDVSVFSNVGIAHLETFGTQAAIAETKGAIIRHLPPGGTAVVNADDPLVMGQATRTDISVMTVGLHGGRLQASDIRYDASGCHFRVTDGTDISVQVRTRLLGAHNVQNILLGFGVGLTFGLRMETMALAASRIEPVEHRLELKPAGRYTIIDDAFNSNPVGAANAVEVLRSFTGGRRVIVTPGMVELGDVEEAENRRFGEAIGRSGIELAILVGLERSRPIADGIRSTGFPEDRIRVEASLFTANEFLRSWLQQGDVVLYENDLPDVYAD